MNAAVLIPAYRPGAALIGLLRELRAFPAIVLVDDGSGPEFQQVFRDAAALPNVHLRRHDRNLGKGAALKTGIEFVRSNFPGLAGIVTADADGQHRPDDIELVARTLEAHPHSLVLGARGFQGEVPLRSRLGNTLSRWVMQAVVGHKLSDTQTGLRGIPAALLPHLLEIESNGYEFELEMLIAARRLSVPLLETPIHTIYERGNPTSHFNPLVDSMKIYFVLLRFASVSLMTAVLDNVVFYLAYRRTGHILTSQIWGRAFAVAFNYWMVRRSVFYSEQRHLAVFPKYLALVLLSGAVSYGGIRLVSSKLAIQPVAAKLMVETLLFFANFAVQRLLIFDTEAAPEAATSSMAVAISWLVFLSLAAVVGIEIYGFATRHLFAQEIWVALGTRRLIRYACLFVEAGLPLLLMAPWLFTGTAAMLVVAGSALAAPWGLCAAAFFLLSAWTLGSKLVRGAGAPCAILAGTAIYIFLMTLTARLPVNYPLAWAALLAVPILVDPRLAWRGLCDLWASIRGSRLTTGGERATFALLVFVTGMHWLVALKPVNGADSLAMHLAIPANLAAHHQMTYQPARFLWSMMPMGADWAYAITYLLGGESASSLLNFAMLLVLLALCYQMVRRWVTRSTAFLLVALFASTPLVQLVSGGLFVENVLAALLLGAIAALWRYAETGEGRFFCLSAALGGAALNVKLGAIALLLPLLPFAIWEARRRRLQFRACLLALALLLAAALPTYAIAWRQTGNPLFPFLNQTFPSPLLDPSVVIRDYRFRQLLTPYTPFDLTFRTKLFYEGQDGSFGFQYLLLLPLSLLGLLAVKRREPLCATVVAFSAMVLVLRSEPNVRYLYAALPLLLVPLAALLGWLQASRRALHHTLIILLLLSAALNICFLPASGWTHKDFYSQLVFAPHGRDRFLHEEVPIRDVTIHFSKAHPGAALLFAGESDLADMAGDAYVPNWHQYSVYESVRNAAGWEDMLRLLRQWNVRYLIVPAASPIEFPGLRDLVERCAAREYANRWFYLERIDWACRP